MILNQVALYYRIRRAESERLLKRTLAISEKIYLPKHPDISISLNTHLYYVYKDAGRYAEAEPILMRALAILQKTEDPSIVLWLNELTNLYEHTGRYAAAEPVYQHAIAILEKTSPNSVIRMLIYLGYADLLDQLGRPAEAATLRALYDKMRPVS